MVNITITGDAPSKKNKQQIIYARNRPMIIPSRIHKIWHSQAMPQLFGIKPIAGQIEAIGLKFFPSTKRLFDLSNKTESIMDLLVDAGIIEDDNYGIVPKLILEIGEQDKLRARCEITIYEQEA